MNLDEIIYSRQSTRKYNADRDVSEKDINAICESARLAPSACNSQTWRFIVITDKDILKDIYTNAMQVGVKNAFLKNVPCLIVGCSKLDLIANTIGRSISGIDYYQIDLGIAMEHIVLKATELELATCWIGWFNKKKIKKILNIPKSVKVLSLLALGYAEDNAEIRKKNRKNITDIVFKNTWKNK